MTNEHQDPEPTAEVKALTADLLDRLALDAAGQPFDDNNPDTWADADAVEPEVVRLGSVRFKVIDADARALALVAGAVEDGAPPVLCMRVAFDQGAGQPEPCPGQYVVVPTDEPGVSITLICWLTHSDLHDRAAPDFGTEAQRDPALDALQPGEALLVQVLPEEESEASQ